jgi:hypothetical protein
MVEPIGLVPTVGVVAALCVAPGVEAVPVKPVEGFVIDVTTVVPRVTMRVRKMLYKRNIWS